MSKEPRGELEALEMRVQGMEALVGGMLSRLDELERTMKQVLEVIPHLANALSALRQEVRRGKH